MICPRCKRQVSSLPALSRREVSKDKEMICRQCGTQEALFDYKINQPDAKKTMGDLYDSEIRDEKAWTK